MTSLADLAINYMYKDDFGMGPVESSLAISIYNLPWVVKPLWGLISDTYPLLGF